MRRGFIYFIAPVGGGPIKIGFSTMPARRLQEMFVWSPVPLEILAFAPGTLRTEKSVHDKFITKRMHGEWFEPHELLLEYIKTIITSGRFHGLKPPQRKLRHRNDLRAKALAHIIGCERLLSFGVQKQ